MKHNFILKFAFLVGVLAVCSEGIYSQTVKSSAVITEATRKKATGITKDILKTRLAKKGIEAVPVPSAARKVRPNPLTLQLKFGDGTNGTKFYLNRDPYKSVDEVIKALQAIFKEREDYGVLRKDSNEVEKEILLEATADDIAFYNSNNIYVEDFERLVDDLLKAGIDQLKLDLNKPDNMVLTVPGDDKKTKPRKPVVRKKN